jgi:hypothetical protein
MMRSTAASALQRQPEQQRLGRRRVVMRSPYYSPAMRVVSSGRVSESGTLRVRSYQERK